MDHAAHQSWLSLAVLGGAALAASLYVTFGPEENGAKSERRRRTRGRRKEAQAPPGLANLRGNQCFVNAVLQALAAVPAFKQWLQEHKSNFEEEGVGSAFIKLMEYLDNEDDDPEGSALDLFKALRRHGWLISSEEHDALEMLHVCFTSLEEELQRGNRDGCKSPLETSVVGVSDDEDGTEEEEEEEEEDKEDPAVSVGIPSRTSSFSRSSPSGKRPASGIFSRCASDLEISLESIHKQVSTRAARHTATPFSGTLANKVTTYKVAEPSKKTASSSPVSSTAFNTVSLSLPRMSSPMFAALQSVTLETLLQMFVSRESVDGGRCFKQTTFGRLPRCLCFHVQRTTYEGGVVGKRSDQVVLPQFLNMEMFSYTGQMLKERMLSGEFGDPTANRGETVCSARRGPSASYYRLCSVIVHFGGSGGGGHYVTYRRVKVREDRQDENSRGISRVEKWFMISDQQVEEVDIAQVLRCQVYAAFYEICEKYLM